MMGLSFTSFLRIRRLGVRILPGAPIFSIGYTKFAPKWIRASRFWEHIATNLVNETSLGYVADTPQMTGKLTLSRIRAGYVSTSISMPIVLAISV